MKNAAFGIRVHSGWGVLVCICADLGAPEIVDRRRIVIVEPAMEGAKQPYHFAENLGLEEAERHLQRCAAVSQGLAVQAIREMLDGVTARKYRVLGCAMLLASGRALPSLQKILASHPLIHTAEGEFFRKAIRDVSAGEEGSHYGRFKPDPVVHPGEPPVDGDAVRTLHQFLN